MFKLLIEVDDYMADCESRGLSSKTMRSYDQTLRLFIRYLQDIHDIHDVKDIKAEHIKAYFTYIRERGKYSAVANDRSKDINGQYNRKDIGEKVSETTIANYQRNINAFFNYLRKERIIRKNPTEGIQRIKAGRKAKTLLSEQELYRFFRSFDLSKFHEFRTWMFARLILDTGARIGELSEIVPADIDLRNNAILLRHTKSNKERFIYFSNQTKRYLKSWLEYRDRYTDSDCVFPSIRGNKMDIRTIEVAFRKHSKLIGVEVRPHQLRNNFAKYYLLNGGDFHTLSRLLGHASVEVTQQAYLDFADEEVSRKYQRHSPLNNLNI